MHGQGFQRWFLRNCLHRAYQAFAQVHAPFFRTGLNLLSLSIHVLEPYSCTTSPEADLQARSQSLTSRVLVSYRLNSKLKRNGFRSGFLPDFIRRLPLNTPNCRQKLTYLNYI